MNNMKTKEEIMHRFEIRRLSIILLQWMGLLFYMNNKLYDNILAFFEGLFRIFIHIILSSEVHIPTFLRISLPNSLL